MAMEPAHQLIDPAQVQAWRREFHQYPEPGWCEYRTSARLAEILAPIASQLRPGRDFLHRSFLYDRQVNVAVEQARAGALGACDQWLEWLGPLPGLIAVIDSGTPGPTVALRIDMDALQLNECADPEHPSVIGGYQSCYPGVMHGCAHDGHMAIGLAVAHLLAANKRQWRGQFMLVAQPAEEGCRGGRAIAESGALDGVDHLLAFHLGMGFASGTLVVAPHDFLSTTKFDVTFSGQAAHASLAPQDGHNALAAACQAVSQMLAIPRHSGGATRLNIGSMVVNGSRNIIPEHAMMRGETRGSDDQLNQYLMDAVNRIVEGCALSFDVKGRLQLAGESCGITQSPQLAELASEVASSSRLFQQVLPTARFGASEDASWLMRRIQEQGGEALYLVFGTKLRAGHHTGRFDFDESVLWPAANYLVDLVCRCSQQSR